MTNTPPPTEEKKPFEVLVKDLPELNRSHLAWRLDAKTVVGYITAGHIARCSGEWGQKTLYEIFTWAGCSPHSAKIHANKVAKFRTNN